MQDFRTLQVWRKAHALEMAARQLTKAFPVAERYELSPQIRRSAASIAANIVEGTSRGYDRDCIRFLRIATASTSELIHHLVVARESGLVTESSFGQLEALAIEVRRMLCGFVRSIEQHPSPRKRPRNG